MTTPEPHKRYRYQDYEQWEGRWELIHGVPYDMSPAPSTKHQAIVTELLFSLRSYFGKGECRVFAAPFDIRLSESDDYDNPDTVVQPDLSVICNPEQLDSKGGKGAPRLIVEVLSPATALKDRNQKYKLYEKHGVKEYWIVDSIHETIEVYGLVDHHYVNRAVFGKEDTLTSFVFPEFHLELKTVFQ
ncbi:Uma2 family endonuclease [Ureibacillus sp. FSL K6-8385]|uniref:Uma2 family endonuclease n=1 Tax=Ureibacillus terrenus TaxID=118246 RepID=A0A540V4Q3_9BACL|nr:Uma2 family endonuclease [Ureibacillus terrenus]MED3661585.1 Uma2 family endonuclease [Ureibacillus terrenus]MED3763897.1 Uma2 family endonuclease [Ureibacillus terrenus]TQE91731.1 Uma2 family endonuclease [Ureibacillus terrenus]